MQSENCIQSCAIGKRVDKIEMSQERHGERINKLETDNEVKKEQYNVIIKKLDRIEGKHEETLARIESIEKTNTSQSQTLTELNERGKRNQERLDNLESKPGKRWEGLVEKAIWAVVAAVIAFILARVGL